MNRIKIMMALLFVAGWSSLYNMIPLESGRVYTFLYPKDNDHHDLYNKRVRLYKVPFLNPEHVSLVDPSIGVKKLRPEEKIGVCYDYAMKTILRKHGIDINFHVIGCDLWINRLSFFKPVKNIQKGDLVVYVNSVVDLQAEHFAIVKSPATREMGFENIVVKDKWATMRAKMTHYLFDLPINWGNAALLFRLKKVYRTSGLFQIKLLQEIRFEQLASPYAQERMVFMTRLLFDFCSRPREAAGTVQNLIMQHLEQHPFLSVNTQDSMGNTPLIKAVENNNIATAFVLCNHGANVSIHNRYGHSPLTIARWNNNREMVELLQRYDMRPQ